MPDRRSPHHDSDDASADESALDIQRKLRTSGHQALRQIECEYRDGTVVLRGRVPTYYAKQLAQSVLLIDPAVHAIENLLEVVMGSRRFQGR